MKLKALFTILLALSLSMAGCGLPKDLKQEAEAQDQRINDLAMKITEKRNSLERFAKSDEYEKFAKYAERENWEGMLDEAQHMLNKGRTDYDQKVTPLLEANKKDQAPDLIRALGNVRGQLRKTDQASERVEKRIAFLRDVMSEPEPMVEKAEQDFSALTKQTEATSQVLEKAKADYPDKIQDIDAKFAPVLDLKQESAQALDKAHAQLEMHKSSENADYAVLGDSCTLIAKDNETVKADCAALEKRSAELYKSYSKVLEDMRVDYFVAIGRTSWDNNAEYDRDNDYTYPSKQVDAESYEILASLPENTVLARYRGNFYSSVDNRVWKSLNFNPTQDMSAWDDEAEFWISDMDAKFYHKYLIIEGANQRKTDWIEVDEDVFDKYEDALGMTIMSKPYGMYEDEALTEPMPPGMEYVGNSKYGEWRQDSGGRSFWHWYGQYAFFRMLMGNRYYYRGDYDHWYRDYRGRRPYYGRGADTWGTYSSHGRTTYSNSHYGRSGGFSRSTPTVRGSGPASRGGGPGTRGK